MGRRKIDGPNTLDRWSAEPHIQHRSMLLFAMQDPGSGRGFAGRSIAPLVELTGKGRATVRQWANKRRWVERMDHHGTDVQTYAIELYRAFYMEDHGRADLVHVAHLVSAPLTTAPGPDGAETPTQAEAVKVVRRMLPPDPPANVQEKVQAEVDKKRSDALKQNRAIRGVALEGLKAIQQGIKAAVDKEFAKKNPHVVAVRVSLSDVPRIQDVLRSLSEEAERLENPEARIANGPQLVDSLRVRIAKHAGGNVLEAMRDDSRELVAILDAMLMPDLSVHDLEAAQAGG